MPSHDPRIDAYIAKSAEFARPILEHLRELVHQGCPDAEETIKWGFPHFLHGEILCSMASFKAHCAFIFWKAELLAPKYPVLAKSVNAAGMGSFGRVTSARDLPSDATLVRMIKDAAKLNDEGAKVPSRDRAKAKAAPPVVVPAYLKTALGKNAKAKKAFDAFPPSHRKEYVAWLEEAKTDATRTKRLATAIGWIAEGKGRNWKYER